MRPLDLLLLCDFPARTGDTVRDHIRSLERFSRHNIRIENVRLADVSPYIDFSRFDGIVIHYTLTASYDTYVSRSLRDRLAAFKGLKALFIQDEYRFVNGTIATMREIGVNLLFTCVPEPEIEKVYPADALPGVAKVNVLTGYVPEALTRRPVPPYSQRPIDIGYRGRKLPMWLGRLGQEKWRIAERVQSDAARYGLVTDISYLEKDRIYGDGWINFICSCKATLGVESGASVFDFTGEIQRNVEAHVARHPDASFEEIERTYLAEQEGRIRLNQISPRCFEAAALRTLMILYEGDYSGVLVPWRHYVPLKKDHSNMAEVAALLRQEDRVAEIVDRAYREVALNERYSFKQSVMDFDAAVERRMEPPMLRAGDGYDPVALVLARARGVMTRWYARVLWSRLSYYPEMAAHHFFVRVCLGWLPPKKREAIRDRIRRWRGIEVGKAGDLQAKP